MFNHTCLTVVCSLWIGCYIWPFKSRPCFIRYLKFVITPSAGAGPSETTLGIVKARCPEATFYSYLNSYSKRLARYCDFSWHLKVHTKSYRCTLLDWEKYEQRYSVVTSLVFPARLGAMSPFICLIKQKRHHNGNTESIERPVWFTANMYIGIESEIKSLQTPLFLECKLLYIGLNSIKICPNKQ